MKYQGILFDLDGVICFTDKYHYAAWKELADTLHIPFDETINDRLRGVSRMESLEIILEKYTGVPLSTSQKEDLATQKNELYKTLLQQMSPADLGEDVQKTLQGLRNKGLTLAIGSSSRNAPFILERLGLGTFFDAVVDGNQIEYSKPHPEVFLKAAAAIGVPPAQCLVVEDADAGVASAKAAEIDCAAIGSATATGQATYNLNQLSDLLALV